VRWLNTHIDAPQRRPPTQDEPSGVAGRCASATRCADERQKSITIDLGTLTTAVGSGVTSGETERLRLRQRVADSLVAGE